MKERLIRLFLGICYICLAAALLISHIQNIAGRLQRTFALLETLALAVFAGVVLLLYIRVRNTQDNQEDEKQASKRGAQTMDESMAESERKPAGHSGTDVMEIQESAAVISTEEQFAKRVEPYFLSGRELEVAWLLFRGYTNRQIAEELFIAETTVKKHVTHIYEKMQITGRKEFKEKVKNPKK